MVTNVVINVEEQIRKSTRTSTEMVPYVEQSIPPPITPTEQHANRDNENGNVEDGDGQEEGKLKI